MTPEKAREILNNCIWRNFMQNKLWGFPVKDMVIHEELDGDVLNQYSFRYLIKIAYNLQDK